MPLTIGSSGKVSEGTYSKPSDYASSQRSKEREREDRYEQQRRNFFSGIFGGGGSGGGGSSGGNRDLSRTRPQMRPATLARPTIKAPTDADFKNLDYSNVPYFSGPNIRPKNMVFKDGVYVPDPTKKPGLADFLRMRSEMPKSMATDLKLGLGSLSGPEGFTKALEGLGYGTFRNDDGSPSAEAMQAYTNFQDASENTADNAAAASTGDGDDFYGNYDPCPEGYRTDPVTGMCVPVMGVAYETAPAAPAQYQGNFVGSPFPDLAPRVPAAPMGRMPMAGYTQPIDYVRPTISPPTPQGIAGIPMTPIIG